MRIFLTIIFSLMLFGCSKPDGTDLDKTVEYYYSPGKAKLPAKDTYGLLTSKAKEQLPLSDYEKSLSENKDQIQTVKVLRKEQKDGKTYAIVSINYKNKDQYLDVSTHTWLLENGKWRRNLFTSSINEADRMQTMGNYNGSLLKVDEILKDDPFNISAFGLKLNLINDDTVKVDVINTMLGINKDDTKVIFSAASHSNDYTVAKSFLKELIKSDYYESAAANIVETIPGLENKLKFIEEMKLSKPVNLQRKIKYYALLGKYSACRQSASKNNFYDEMAKVLDIQTIDFAAYISYQIFVSTLSCGDGKIAQQFFDYSAKRSPNNNYTLKAAKILSSKDPQSAARLEIAKLK